MDEGRVGGQMGLVGRVVVTDNAHRQGRLWASGDGGHCHEGHCHQGHCHEVSGSRPPLGAPEGKVAPASSLLNLIVDALQSAIDG